MQKVQAIVPLAAIVALVAMLVQRAGTNELHNAPSGQSRSTDSSSASPARFSDHSEDDGLDTLDVIGRSLGTDVTSDGLRRRALRASGVIAAPERFPNSDWRRHRDLLHDVLTLPIPGKNLSRARAAVAALADCTPPADNIPTEFKHSRACQAHADTVGTFLTNYLSQDGVATGSPDAKAKPVTPDFDAIDKNNLKLAVLRRAADEQNIQVAFLIATLPDPIDSYTGWQFDPMLDAIAQAIAAKDFILDRFHFPDSDPEEEPLDKASSGSHRLHEVEPGVVIFRRHVTHDAVDDNVTEPASNSARTRLVLLIAHENPSAGVHIRSLAAAIRLVVDWCNGQAEDKQCVKEPIRILGPSFSGTSDSIVRALQLVKHRVMNGGYRMRFVSGSATDRSNQSTIESAFDPRPETDSGKKKIESTPTAKRIRFQATVQPDHLSIPKLKEHLEKMGWSFPIAVLFEANTQYGRGMLKAWEPLSTGSLPQFIQLPFPMNLSRLRATVQADQTRSADVLGQPTRFRSLSMEEMGNPVDKLPQFHPSTAAAYGELAVSEMLQTMRQEQVKTVALLATDPRDKLFLAQQIARNAPDMSIVTVESESLYIHPDYASYLQGALVASTYPLYSTNQRWSYGYEGRTQRRHFANGAAQGIYNAAIALLDYNEDGTQKIAEAPHEGEERPRLLEYGPPEGMCPCQPPVWISVIGRGTAWPVAAYPLEATSADALADSYVFMVQEPRMHAVPAILPSPWFTGMFLLLTASVAGLWVHAHKTWWTVPKAHAAAERDAADGWYTPAAKGPGSIDAGTTAGAAGAEIPVTTGLLPYQVACVVTLVVIEIFVGLLFGTRLFLELQARDEPLKDINRWGVVALVVVTVSLALLLDLARRVVRKWRAGLKSATRDHPSPRRAAVVTLTVVVICLWALWSFGRYLTGDTLSAEARVGFVTRAMNLGSGVSPTLPIAFLTLVVLLWGLTELARRRGPRVELADDKVKPLLNQAMLGDVTSLQKPWRDATSSILDVPRPLLMVALLPPAITCVFSFDPFFNPLISVEGEWFGRFVSTLLLLVQCMLVLALLQFVFLWSKLHGLLDRMSWHEMSAAYERIPRNLFPPDLLPRVPRLIELQPLVEQWQKCVHAAGWGSTRNSQTLSSDCFEVAGTFETEMRQPDRAWATSRTWSALIHAAVGGMDTLRSELIPVPAARAVSAATRSAPSEGGQASAHAVQLYAVGQAEPAVVTQAHEELIAMSMTLLIRDALARLGQNLVFVILGVLLVFCSHTLFPFQARQRLELLGWIYIGLTFTAILTVLVQMKRNEIIGRLTAAAPGQRATWDGAFVLKLAVFGLLPLLTLFAAQFPDLGGTLLRWLEPVQKALP